MRISTANSVSTTIITLAQDKSSLSFGQLPNGIARYRLSPSRQISQWHNPCQGAYMSKLIQIRQRIKAIETIKKITHAMRLVSMSSHSRLRGKREALTRYADTVDETFNYVRRYVPDWSHHAMGPAPDEQKRRLVILVGSQKSLCGTFNIALLNYYKRHGIEEIPTDIVVVGKKTVELVKELLDIKPHAAFEKLSPDHIATITRSIGRIIFNASPAYSRVELYGNILKTFFSQRPTTKTLLPLEDMQQASKPSRHAEEAYLWEHEPKKILDVLLEQYIESRVQHALFESLLAEQAARFVSMDNSTRNAQKLLETTQARYNKLRQAKITKELTELTGSYS